MHTSGVRTGRCTIEDLARVLSENTARRFDLYPQKGALGRRVGRGRHRVRPGRAEAGGTPSGLHSAAGYSLYDGESLTGWPEKTFVRGNLVFDGGAIVAKTPVGRHVPQA